MFLVDKKHEEEEKETQRGFGIKLPMPTLQRWSVN